MHDSSSLCILQLPERPFEFNMVEQLQEGLIIISDSLNNDLKQLILRTDHSSPLLAQVKNALLVPTLHSIEQSRTLILINLVDVDLKLQEVSVQILVVIFDHLVQEVISVDQFDHLRGVLGFLKVLLYVDLFEDLFYFFGS